MMSASEAKREPSGSWVAGVVDRPAATLPHPMVSSHPAPPANGRLPLPPSLTTGPDMAALLKALRRRWFLATCLAIMAVPTAAATAFTLIPPKYTAYATLKVSSNITPFIFKEPSDSRAEYNIFQKTQLGLIKSRFVLTAALRQPGIAQLSMIAKQPDPIAWLEEEIKPEYMEGSEILKIPLSGEQPTEIAAIVNAIKDAYIQEVVDVEKKERVKHLNDLEQIKTRSQRDLEGKRRTLETMKEALGVSSSSELTIQQKIMLDKFVEMQREHARLQTELKKAKMRLTAQQGKMKSVETFQIPDGELEDLIGKDSQCQLLQTRVSRLDAAAKKYQKIAARSNEPTLLGLQRDHQGALQELEARRAKLRQEYVDIARRRVLADAETNLATAQSEADQLIDEEKVIREQVEKIGKEIEKIGKKSANLDMLQEEINQESRVAQAIADRLAKEQVELQSPLRVQPLQAADVPQKKDMKRQLMLTSAAGLGSLGLVLFGISWFEVRTRRINTTDEVINGLNMRVVGALPALPVSNKRRKPNDPNDIYWRNLLNESVDGIRTMLLRDAKKEGTQIVMVSSALDREGKTTLASHLAASFARAGRRTLLIDCDFRRPALHQLFEMPLEPGFCDALCGEIDVASVVQSTPVTDLSLIPAGRWTPQIVKALAQQGVQAIFDELRKEYDFIIVDSYPILAATDSLLIGQAVDAVILSLLRDVSRSHHVFSAYQKLVTLGIRVFGTVMSGERAEVYHLHDLRQGPTKG